MIGCIFNKLTVISFYGKDKWGKRIWNCICDCGNIRNISESKLKGGVAKSCGCLRKETLVKRNISHGSSDTKTYRIWKGMLSRCYNKNTKAYSDYGGRGIIVCDKWLKFENFHSDMGDCLGKMEIDRINNDGNYEPNNCKWSTRLEQSNNKRSNRPITFNGETLNVTQWAHRLNVNVGMLVKRLNRGWSAERIITTPSSCKKPVRPVHATRTTQPEAKPTINRRRR